MRVDATRPVRQPTRVSFATSRLPSKIAQCATGGRRIAIRNEPFLDKAETPRLPKWRTSHECSEPVLRPNTTRWKVFSNHATSKEAKSGEDETSVTR